MIPYIRRWRNVCKKRKSQNGVLVKGMRRMRKTGSFGVLLAALIGAGSVASPALAGTDQPVAIIGPAAGSGLPTFESFAPAPIPAPDSKWPYDGKVTKKDLLAAKPAPKLWKTIVPPEVSTPVTPPKSAMLAPTVSSDHLMDALGKTIGQPTQAANPTESLAAGGTDGAAMVEPVSAPIVAAPAISAPRLFSRPATVAAVKNAPKATKSAPKAIIPAKTAPSAPPAVPAVVSESPTPPVPTYLKLPAEKAASTTSATSAIDAQKPPAPDAPQSLGKLPAAIETPAAPAVDVPAAPTATNGPTPAPVLAPPPPVTDIKAPPQTAPNLPDGVKPLLPPTIQALPDAPAVPATAPSATLNMQESAESAPSPVAAPVLADGTSGSPIRLTFAVGSDALSADSKATVQALAEKLKTTPGTRLGMEAYATTETPIERDARRLSLARALAVRSALIQQGIPATRMDVRALGKAPDGQPPERVDILLKAE
jgi:outer membrane protein OmpA-like peptidoglycan-associated protein